MHTEKIVSVNMHNMVKKKAQYLQYYMTRRQVLREKVPAGYVYPL